MLLSLSHSERFQYQKCVSLCDECRKHFTSLKGTTSDDSDVTVGSLESITALYQAEALSHLNNIDVRIIQKNQLQEAIHTLDPDLHPDFYDPEIVKICHDFSQLESNQDSIEQCIQKNQFPLMETLIYNLTLVEMI